MLQRSQLMEWRSRLMEWCQAWRRRQAMGTPSNWERPITGNAITFIGNAITLNGNAGVGWGGIWKYLVIEGRTKNYQNHENQRADYSVRPDWPSTGPKKSRTIFPHTSVLSKPLKSGAHGAQTKYKKGAHFITTIMILGGFPSPQKKQNVGVIFQNGFSPKAVQPETPGV